jgi:hypothetical protein
MVASLSPDGYGALAAAVTDTVVDAVTLPAELRAVSTYVVDAVGDTERVVDPVTSPMALSSDRLVAPDTDQDNVVACPAVIDAGVAEKLEITGGVGGGALPPPPPVPAPPPPPPHAAVTDSAAIKQTMCRHCIARLRSTNLCPNAI